MQPQGQSWVVMKFGGTSVASPRGWETIERAVRTTREEGAIPLVVCSAIGGVSDQLEHMIARAVCGEACEDELEALHQRHVELAVALDIELPDGHASRMEELRLGLDGVRLVREASPRVRARLLATGELLSTSLGARWLAQRGLDAEWVDARTLLEAKGASGEPAESRYLSATVRPDQSPDLSRRLGSHDVVITQGFIARDEEDHTVLLGRGGSDTSAAYFGVLFGARRVEIWTDVPGMFTSNPSDNPRARLLRRVGYDEAAALASLGARVLHPRCVPPLRTAGIPLHVRSTYMPDAEGTVVGDFRQRGIRAVTARSGLILLTMRRPSMWQPVGFLADVAECFRTHDLSIDLLATSASTIQATVDPLAAPSRDLEGLLADLERVADVNVTRPVASVSVVGTGVTHFVRSSGAAISEVQGTSPFMIVHGASDHHVTFVVEAGHKDDLVERVHALLFEQLDMVQGPEWSELQEKMTVERVPQRWSRPREVCA